MRTIDDATAATASAIPRPAPPPAVETAPPLAAALEYAARTLVAELELPPTRPSTPRASTRLSPAGAELLRWWCAEAVCRARVANFNAAQRQALVHLLLAHEILRSDDAGTLRDRACGPAAAAPAPPPLRAAHHVLRLAPGCGLRWIAQALVVWHWACAVDEDEARVRIVLTAATSGIARRLRDALSADADASLRRHARLFLPPGRRAAFFAWLARARGGRDPTLRVRDGSAVKASQPGPLTVVAETRTVSGDTRSRVRVDLCMAAPATGTGPEPLTDIDAARTIRRGACKLPVLVAVPVSGSPLPAAPPRHPGRRPRLGRVHRAQLDAGLRELVARDAAFAALDPARRPRIAILCDAPITRQAARRWLHAAGFDPAVIADAGDAPVADGVRVVFDTLPPRATLADARICVVVALRTQRGDAALAAVLPSMGAPLLWPEPDFAELRADSLERAARGRPPRHRMDVLALVDDPRCRGDHDALPHAPPPAADVPSTDDVFVAGLREGAGCDPALPPDCDAGPDTPPDRLGDVPFRLLRARRSMPVTKSVHTHAPCDDRDGGLRAAFLACAEADPAIERHDLIDPRRHAVHAHEALLARTLAAGGWPDALVYTATHVHLVTFLPFCPAAPLAPTAAERALARWLQHVDALPPMRRDDRRWRWVVVPAPLFWSWKRSGGRLSDLLATLSGTAGTPALAAPARFAIPAPAP
jgi:hypothetical protein